MLKTDDINLRELQIKARERTVKTQNIEYDLETIVKKIENNTIKLNPEYQRNHRWSDDMSSKLIESLILNIPVPTIYISQDIDVDTEEENAARYTVIDGQQRLSSIKRFMENNLTLCGLEMLDELNGCRYKDLPPFLIRRLEERTIKCLRIDSTADSQVKFDIFERLNSGSIQLKPQELRNAIFGGPFNDCLKRLAKSHSFRSLLNINQNSPDDNDRVKTMGDAEMVLRLFSFSNGGYLEYRKGFMQFLTVKMREFSTFPIEKISDMEDDFHRTMDACLDILGTSAFTKYKIDGTKTKVTSKFNASVFDAIAVSFYDLKSNVKKIDKEKCRTEIKELFRDKEFSLSISGTTNDSNKVRYRINVVKELLNQCIV